MNRIERILQSENPALSSKLSETIKEVTLLLGKYNVNFPMYTDHSIEHVKQVFYLVSELLTPEEIENLNCDELYVLGCASFLHDVGMCIPQEKIEELISTENFKNYKGLYPESSSEDFLRNIHHEVSYEFILKEWKMLKIENEKYAKAIALVAKGHRVVDLSDINIYESKFFVKQGREFICLPYLASILRIADELDVTTIRTPKLLTKYYMPNNKHSIREWQKHIATTQVNFTEDKVIYDVICTDQTMYAALQEQFEKIQANLNYCQKIIRGIANTEKRSFELTTRIVEPKYQFMGFDPKGIRYSFDVQNVITAFIGDNLYDNKLVAIREALQNSIDSCRYRKLVFRDSYKPLIKVKIDAEKITIDDNGMGMDEFIIETFFGRLGSSFYEQEKVKDSFEAIGQFGVGVFSYFLLAEYIDIDTKTDKNKALKFRIDKDPKNYFHFFDSSTKVDNGTTITIFLKPDYVGKFNGLDIENYIGYVFRFIEFPIEILYEERVNVLMSQNIAIDYKLDVVPMFDLVKSEKQFDLELLDVAIDNSDYIGHCGIVVSKNKQNPFKYFGGLFDISSMRKIFRRYHSTESIIDFCQKGVFVASYDSTASTYFFGKVDIKKKIKINIDRNSFSDLSVIDNIINDFEVAILEKIYINYFKDQNMSDRVSLSVQLLSGYLRGISNVSENNIQPYKKTLESLLYMDVFFNDKISSNSIPNIFDSYDSFFLVPNEMRMDSIKSDFSEPIIVTHGIDSYQSLLEILTKFYGMTVSVRYSNKMEAALFLSKQKDMVMVFLEQHDNINFKYIISTYAPCNNNKHIIVFPQLEEVKRRYFANRFINIEHPFTKKYIEYIRTGGLESVDKKIFRSIFDYIFRIDMFPDFSLAELNSLVAKLKNEYQYVFSNEDFNM